MNYKDILAQLCSTQGVSGNEGEVCILAGKILADYGDTQVNENTGCVFCKRFGFDDSKPTILLDAHIDEIGMIVTYITNEGFLKVSACGGIDRRVLLAQQVTVYGKKKIAGFITSTPPHLCEDTSKAPDFDEIFIDIGYTKEQAEEIVSAGDWVLIENASVKLMNNRVTSKALDDRSGVASIILALDMLKDKNLNCNVVAMFSSQEEVGERGAKIGAFKINPDRAIIVDVSFAKVHGENAESVGKLGEGVMIGIAPSLSREMVDKMIALAKDNKISYQLEVMDGKTGTNADVIGVSQNGVQTVTLSIPQKHMHTPVEIVDYNDILSTSQLIVKYLESV